MLSSHSDLVSPLPKEHLGWRWAPARVAPAWTPEATGSPPVPLASPDRAPPWPPPGTLPSAPLRQGWAGPLTSGWSGRTAGRSWPRREGAARTPGVSLRRPESCGERGATWLQSLLLLPVPLRSQPSLSSPQTQVRPLTAPGASPPKPARRTRGPCPRIPSVCLALRLQGCPQPLSMSAHSSSNGR